MTQTLDTLLMSANASDIARKKTEKMRECPHKGDGCQFGVALTSGLTLMEQATSDSEDKSFAARLFEDLDEPESLIGSMLFEKLNTGLQAVDEIVDAHAKGGGLVHGVSIPGCHTVESANGAVRFSQADRLPIQEFDSWLKPALGVTGEIMHAYLIGEYVLSSKSGSPKSGDDLYLMIVADIDPQTLDRERTHRFRWLTELAASRGVYWEVVVYTPEEAARLELGTDKDLPDDCVHVFSAE